MAPLPASVDCDAFECYCQDAERIAYLLHVACEWPDFVKLTPQAELTASRRSMTETLEDVLAETNTDDSDLVTLFTKHGCGPCSLLGANGASSHAAVYGLWHMVWGAARDLGGQQRLDSLLSAATGLCRRYPNVKDALGKVSARLEYEKTQVSAKLFDRPPTPVTHDANDKVSGKGKRGTKRSKTRKTDIAITLVVRNPELTDAEVARQAGCDRSLLTRNEEYQNNADMARRALVRQQRQAGFDARTGEAYSFTDDPEVD